jgi:hypothetical protein
MKFHYSPDADLIRQIMEEYKHLRQLQINVIFWHVRGHQDRLKRQLTLPEQLNVKADHLATEALRIRSAPPIILPSLIATITMDDKQISASYTTIMRDAYSSINLRNHLKSSNNWSEQTLETLWWKPIGSAMCARPAGEQRTLIKYLHNRLPCNRKQNCYYGYISPKCDLCVLIDESQNHIIQCQGCQLRIERRNLYLSELEKYLESSRTNIETRAVIINYVRSWLLQQPIPNIRIVIPEASAALKKAITEQTAIGWEHWFKGRLTSSWGILYNHDLNTTNHGIRNQSAEKWSRKIIDLNWDFFLQAWNIRNEIEHSTDGDQIRNQKDKLIAKIMWTKTKILNFPTSYLHNITEDQIRDLPLGNLKMLDSQIQTLKRASGRQTTTAY